MKACPGPKGSLLMGVLPEFRKHAPEFLLQVARDYGDLARLRLGPRYLYLVSNPDWIKDILVTYQANFTKSRVLERARVLLGNGLLTSEGEFHVRQRRLIQPAFHRDRLAGYASAMVECAVRCRNRLESGTTLDIAGEMMRLTLAIVARVLFSADVTSEADEIGVALGQLLELYERMLSPLPGWVNKLPLPSVRRSERARERLNRTILRIIAEHRASGRDSGDLVSMLLRAQDDETHGGMTDQQIRDETLTLFLAGHETTANALTWTWFLLSQNPEAESKLHAEIDRVLAGRLPVFEDLPQLRYSEMVFSEALRLYPPAWGIGRRAIRDYRIGDYTIPARSIILMSPYVVHRDPRWFSQPEQFDPDRWLPGKTETRPKFSYFPFGGGTRACIGERFAWMEGVLLLATLAQRWSLRLMPGHPVETRALITLRTRYGMRMRVESRPSGCAPI